MSNASAGETPAGETGNAPQFWVSLRRGNGKRPYDIRLSLQAWKYDGIVSLAERDRVTVVTALEIAIRKYLAENRIFPPTVQQSTQTTQKTKGN